MHKGSFSSLTIAYAMHMSPNINYGTYLDTGVRGRVLDQGIDDILKLFMGGSWGLVLWPQPFLGMTCWMQKKSIKCKFV